jgi:hypothetical protein
VSIHRKERRGKDRKSEAFAFFLPIGRQVRLCGEPDFETN